MEIQVKNHGSNIDLKLFLYGFVSFISVFKLGVNFSVERYCLYVPKPF